MMFFVFWITCIFVQKSSCTQSDAHVITNATSQNSADSYLRNESEPRGVTANKSDPTPLDFNEVSHLTTNVNDIECSNTENCVSPINHFTTPTIIPSGLTKITWQPVTSQSIPTNALTTDPISSSRTQHSGTSKPQDETVSTVDDRSGNELDSEVRDMKQYFISNIYTSTIKPIDDLVTSTYRSLSTDNKIYSKATTSSEFSTRSKFSAKESVTALMFEYSTYKVSELQLNDTFLALKPVLNLSSSASTDESSTVPSSRMNSVNTFNLNLTTAEMPVILTTDGTVVVKRDEDTINFFEDTNSSTIGSGVFIIKENVELNVQPMSQEVQTKLQVTTVSGFFLNNSLTFDVSENSKLEVYEGEPKLQTTPIPYFDTVKMEPNIHNSNVTSEPLMKSESYLQVHIVNASDAEVSEGQGLKRNLSLFMTYEPEIITGVKTEISTELYTSKDISTTTKPETLFSAFMPNVNETLFPNHVDLSVEVGTSPASHSNTTAEVTKLSTLITNTNSTTVGDDTSILLTTSYYSTNYSEMNDKNEVKTVHLTATTHTSETKISEQSNSEMSETKELRLKSVEDTTLQFTGIPTNASKDSVLTILSTTAMNLSEFITTPVALHSTDTESSSLETTSFDSNTFFSTNSYMVNKEAETTTFTPIEQRVSLASVTHLPISLTSSSTSHLNLASDKIKMIPFPMDQNPTSSSVTALPNTPTSSVTTPSDLLDVNTESATHILPKQYNSSSVTNLPTALNSSVTNDSHLLNENTKTTLRAFEQTTLRAFEQTTLRAFEQTTTSPSIIHVQTTTSSTTHSISAESSKEAYSPTPSTSSTTLNHSLYLSVSSIDFPNFVLNTTNKETLTSKSEGIDSTYKLTASSEDTLYSNSFATMTLATLTEIHREGKHIPFSTAATRKEGVASSANGIIHVIPTDVSKMETTKNYTEIIYKQIQLDELTLNGRDNLITASIQLSSKLLNKEDIDAKMVKVHSWLLHVLMMEFQNWTRDPFEETEEQFNSGPFGNVSIFYVSPTPEMNHSSITLTFIVYNAWKNETLPVDFVLGILNFYSKELKESINASAAYFYHGYLIENNHLVSAILERYGIIISTVCLAIVGILLLVCVVVFYRKKTRRSVHCLSNNKLQHNMQEAVGIDLTPAIIILQNEKGGKVGNGNKICDDEGWLVPINDVPQAEDCNVPFVQDTKL